MLSPALRLGWLVVPSSLAADVARSKLQADRGSSVFEQLAFGDFLERGELDRHLRRTRHVYRRRRDALVAALHARLTKLAIHGVSAGLHFMIELESDLDERAVVEALARRSVRVYGARDYRANPQVGPPALIVGYGGICESDISQAVTQLALAISQCRRRIDGP